MNNNMKLEFLGISENESFARSAVAAFVSRMNPTLDELDDIKTAVSEAVTNAIVHGYSKGTGTVRIVCIINENDVTILISDEGRGIEDIPLARTPLYTEDKTGERSGLGFTVMETFMDKVEVISSLGKGTTVKMTKSVGLSQEMPKCV